MPKKNEAPFIVPTWPADQQERRDPKALKPNPRNARTHTDEQTRSVLASITEFGWTMPILIDEKDTIIAGHDRTLAAIMGGIEDVPVIVARGWSEKQKRAYMLADNKLALISGWDDTILRQEVEALRDVFDMGVIGFTPVEIAALLDTNAGQADPEEAPEPPAVAVSRLGDVWLLGRHRLVCGDSTNAETVALALDGAKPHLMVTDPPYGVDYDASWRERAGLNGPGAAKGKVMNDGRADWRETWTLFPGDVAYVWHGGAHAGVVQASLDAAAFITRAQIIWAKNTLVMGRGDYHWQHEPCWYAVRKGKNGHWNGDRKQATLWEINKPQKSETGHSTQKPIECMKRPMENNSKPGDAVYEPFSGSGTSIIAAEQCGRRCLAIELDPSYVDVAVLRWEMFTGKKAKHADGRSFDDVRTERQ